MQRFSPFRPMFLSLLFAPAIAHCAAQALVGKPGGGPAADGSTETTNLSAAKVSQYTVGVADVLHVSVWKNPDLSQTVTVGPDGFVSLSLLGDVKVVGSTTSEIGDLLTKRLTAFMLTPQVTVSVVEIRSRQVYVMGQVAKPGGYQLLGQMNVLQILAQAGGLSPFAHRRGIYVLRPNKGAIEKLAYNYSDVMHGKGNQNFELRPGDTVVVP